MAAHGIDLRSDLRPGDLGRLIALHGTAYEGEAGRFGLVFEAFVARTVAEFMIDNGGRGRVFLAERGGDLVGTSAMVAREGGRGQLRWVLTDPSTRGTGLGRRLVEAAIDHARAEGWREVFLETTGGLDVSKALYDRLGFVETSRTRENLWSGEADLIVMALALR